MDDDLLRGTVPNVTLVSSARPIGVREYFYLKCNQVHDPILSDAGPCVNAALSPVLFKRRFGDFDDEANVIRCGMPAQEIRGTACRNDYIRFGLAVVSAEYILDAQKPARRKLPGNDLRQ
jgi:hypothetical protein